MIRLNELGTSMIGLDLDKTQLDRSDMNILDNSVYAIQENFDELNSIDSGNAQLHNSSSSRNDSPDHFKSMLGGINGNLIDGRKTMDLDRIKKKKKGSLIQNPSDISSIYETSNNNSSFNISLLAGSKNNINNLRMSEALPKNVKFSYSGATSKKRNHGIKKWNNSVQKEMEHFNYNENSMKDISEEKEWTEVPKIVENFNDLSSKSISKNNGEIGKIN